MACDVSGSAATARASTSNLRLIVLGGQMNAGLSLPEALHNYIIPGTVKMSSSGYIGIKYLVLALSSWFLSDFFNG